MGLVTVKDDVIWFSHLSDDPPLLHLLMSLADGEVVRLVIDGVGGEWLRMAAGRDGRPTKGIRPVGAMVEVWRAYYRDRKGQTLQVQVAGVARPPRPQMEEGATMFIRDDAKTLYETAMPAERRGLRYLISEHMVEGQRLGGIKVVAAFAKGQVAPRAATILGMG